MGVGNYLSIRSSESARAAENMPEQEAAPARHALATLLAFVAAGSVPLVPYVVGPVGSRFALSILFTLGTLFVVGSLRSLVTIDRWWTAGLEMLLLGVLVAAAAYGSGALVAALVGYIPA